VPWAAYFGDTIMGLSFPETWTVRVYPSTDGPDIGEAGIAEAFASAIGTACIAELARGKRTAAIVVDDLSRPTPAHRLVPRVLAELEQGGITRDRVTIVCGVANHRQMMREDFVKKLGEEVVRTTRVVNHFSCDRCDYVGTTSGGLRVALNRDFLAGDVKILVGGLFPHGTPGFGGAKLVVPGVASIDTCYDLHGPRGPATGLAVDASEARLQMEEAARMAGVSAIVNTVPTSRRGIASMVVGDVVEAHRAAVKMARRVFATRIPREPADVGVFSAYPKDSEYLQIGMAFNVWRTAPRPLVHDAGAVVTCSAASEGPGFHSLIGPERRVPATGGFPAALFAPRDVAVFPWSSIQLADGDADE
jgi:nickel-dependent lactate racemase